MRIFGRHDEQTIIQFEKVRARAVDAALMADGHVGYVMPIGGVAAYRNEVSVVGVGFDIACLAAGTPVTTADGYSLPIEQVRPDHRLLCWDGVETRLVTRHLGSVARGVRPTLRVRLRNGRVIVASGDHRIRTRTGWVPAEDLVPGDELACPAFVGLPYEDMPGLDEILPLPRALADALRARGLLPLQAGDARFAALVRLLGVVSGDGHLTSDGKMVSVYTTDERDQSTIQRDFELLGFPSHTYRRARGAGRKTEIHVRVGSRLLHALLAALGSPVGKKRWLRSSLHWLMESPAWVRAQFLSAFASAEMSTPRMHATGTVPNLQLKQAGEDTHAIELVAELLGSLGFTASIAPSGRRYGERQVYVAQILGGEVEQVRYCESVGFCHAAAKREAAARVASVVSQHRSLLAARAFARDEARASHAAGAGWRDVVENVAERHGVSRGFVYHAIYDRRGTPRRLPGSAPAPNCSGDVCWEPVVGIEPGEELPVYDIVTSDPAHCFVAGGIAVHNCGNAAIRTDLTLGDLGDTPERIRERLSWIADGIAGAVSFGIGRKNRSDDAPIDHPLFEDPAWAAVPAAHRQALLVKARQQLGTVGSGNHYVDVFVDEAGALWVGVHFGSRGLGHTIASAFLAIGQGKPWGERVPEREVLLDVREPAGHDYWHLMALAGRYAYAGREWVARKVVSLLGGRELELVHNHHNFSWRETHGGEELIVVRKGATPAFPGQLGFIGGSMGDDAVIVRGTLADPARAPEIASTQREALYSTVHGAGRVMSRTMAAGKRNRRTGQVLSPGRVTPEMMREWIAGKGVVLRGGGLDESPHVYRRLPEVLAAQEGTVEVLHTLRPLVVVMAGADEFDPYKD